MLQFVYDGTWEGFLSAVFLAYRAPDASLCAEQDVAPSFYEQKTVETSEEHVLRFCAGAEQKLGQAFLQTLESAWLTHEPGIEDSLLSFIRQSFAAGKNMIEHRSDPVVYRVATASGRALKEAHKLKGFVRFRPIGKLYLADLEPTADVLPLLADHFSDRFQEQPFVIRDRNHMRALLWNGRQYAILPFEHFNDAALATADPLEEAWKDYYKAMAIQERKNPALRRQLMPKKYWRNLPEVQALL